MRVLKLNNEQVDTLRKTLTKKEFDTIILLKNDYNKFMSKLFVYTANYYDIENDKTTEKYEVLDNLYTSIRLR